MKLKLMAILAATMLAGACGKGGETAPTEGKPAGGEAAPAEAAKPEAKPAAASPAATGKLELAHKGGSAETIKVQIIEISDFECPFCSRVGPTIKKILETYGDQIRVTWLNNPLPFHKNATGAAKASAAAGKQGKFWEMHDKLFENQRALSEADLEKYATELGLDVAQMKKDMADPETDKFVENHKAISAAVGASGTPGFFLNGKPLKGAQPFEQFKTVIDAELAAADAAGKKGEAWTKERTKANNPDLHAYLFEGKVPAPVQAKKPQPRPVDKTVYKASVDKADASKGNPNALVTLVEFSEFQCPFCKKVIPTVEQVLKEYGDKVRLVFKHNPLPFHKNAFAASEATLCANVQGKFWEMHDKLFENQRALERDKLDQYAADLGLDAGKFKKCMDSHQFQAQIEADQEQAGKVTARGTPNVFVNGRKLTGAKPIEEFKTLIDEEIAKAQKLIDAGTPAEKVYEEIIKDGKVFEPLEAEVQEFELSKTPVLGDKGAKVKVVIFSDFQCPFCSRVGKPVEEVQKHYGKDAAVFFKQFPLSFHKQAMNAAKASLCANEKGKFWEMHDAMFGKQKELADDAYAGFAKEIGLDEAAFKACFDGDKYKEQIEADIAEGRKSGVRGTPTIFINGRKFSSPTGYNLDAFTKVIDKHILKK